MKNSSRLDLSASTLHILALGLMLCDHLWATVVHGNDWLTALGRLAFPIFAFMIVEGYTHTRSLRRYVLRLLLLAIVSELPFNLMCTGRLIYPFHQNVIWTFLLGIGLITLNDRAAKTGKLWLRILTAAGTLTGGYLAGMLTFVDYYGYGVLTLLVFYFFRGRRWQDLAGQIAALGYINLEMMGGLIYPITLFGLEFSVPQQGFALLALIPIWLYRGRAGIKHPTFRIFRYAFYPAHMLILALISRLT